MGRPGYIYVMRLHASDRWQDCPFKIGQSVNPEIRRSQLGIVMPYELSVVKWIPTNDMDWAEDILHDTYAQERLQGEWYRLDEDAITALLRITEMDNDIRYGYWTTEGRFIRPDRSDWFDLGGSNLPF
jgi:Meiotically up-regulated gene 113